MRLYPVQQGSNPHAFLYPAQSILEHDGMVEIFADEGAELQIDLESPRFKRALAQLEELERPSVPYDLDVVISMVERIGDVVFDIFGGYNSVYISLRQSMEEEQMDSVTIGQTLYQELYGEDDGKVLKVSEMAKGTFICPEFAAITAVLCHLVGLRAYVVRAPVAISLQQTYETPSVHGGHSTVLIVDENDEILCLAENAQVTRWDNPMLWQSTVRSLRSITIEDFVNGQPFVGANHYAITALFMGDPIGISTEGYFQHSQYEGTDYTISDKASKALFEHYRSEYINTIENSHFFQFKQLLDMSFGDTLKHWKAIGIHCSPGLLRKIHERAAEHGVFVQLWLVLEDQGVDVDTLKVALRKISF